MASYRKSHPSSGDPAHGCGLLILIVSLVTLVAILIGVGSCAAPFGGSGEPEECEWELKSESLSRSYSLTHGSKSIALVAGIQAKPRPPAPRHRVVVVKPRRKPVEMPKVKPTSTPVKMPVVKTPQAPSKAPKGKRWVYDCD